MKNLFFSSLLTLVTLFIVSCSGDDAGAPIKPVIDLVDENLVGKWKLTNFEVSNGTVDLKVDETTIEIPFTTEGSEFNTTALFETTPNKVTFDGTFKANTNFVTPLMINQPTTREDTFESSKILGGTSTLNDWSISEGDSVIAGSKAEIIKFTKNEIQYKLDIAQTSFISIIEEGFDLNGFTTTNPKGQIIVTLEKI
ncbi:hypothetical protein [Aquimarina agarilytica]|uniref:hypothetical protein n=1 Tax=Aquimarina agarilytica TaxID=1087449 RepID=UPI00028A2598|nr:hypothetical protein [Aquimarina agarilytica]